MPTRSGEKWGWTAGWMGGFIWLAVLAVVFGWKGKLDLALTGAGLTALAVFAILFFAPWRFPQTSLGKLALAPLAVFLAAAGWAIWAHGGPDRVGLAWWHLPILLPFLLPLGGLWKRKWNDGNGPQD